MSTLSEHRAGSALSRGDHRINSAGINKQIQINSNTHISELPLFKYFSISFFLLSILRKPVKARKLYTAGIL